jgi:hypothetical protein
MYQKYLLLLFLFIVCITANSQIQYDGLPLSLKSNISLNDVPVIAMPEIISENPDYDSSIFKSYSFAYTFDTNINPDNSGRWILSEDGNLIWQVGIFSRKAYCINVYFDPFYLPDGAKLFLYSAGYSNIIGAYTSQNNNDKNVLPVSPVNGEIIYIELNISANHDNYLLAIKKVGHGYDNIFNNNSLKSMSDAGSCNIDVNCQIGESWQNTKNAVFRFIFFNSQKKKYEYCTGSLINNTKEDYTPYFITAGHCLFNTEAANTLVACFNYESYFCGGSKKSDKKTITGAEILAYNPNLDFALGKFDKLPPFAFYPYFAGWNHSSIPAKEVTTIHHPSGDVKKISIDFDSVTSASYDNTFDSNCFWRITQWDLGVTEHGSSGCPLFNKQQQIIGTLTGGQATCSSPYDDYYSKFYSAFDKYSDSSKQLKRWLDPINSGYISINGTDPYINIKQTCDTFKAIDSTLNTSIIKPLATWGYYSGTNGYNFLRFAQLIHPHTKRDISGIYFNVAKNYFDNSSSYIIINIWTEGIDGKPDTLLFEKIFYLSNLQTGLNYIDFDNPIKINDNCFIGYDLKFLNIADTFAMYQSTVAVNNNDNYYFYKDNNWQRIDMFSSGLITGMLDLGAVVCDSIPFWKNKIKSKTENINVIIFPNPAKDVINLTLNSIVNFPVKIEIFDLQGKKVRNESLLYSDKNYTINTANLNSGIYLINISNENYSVIKKLIIIK